MLNRLPWVTLGVIGLCCLVHATSAANHNGPGELWWGFALDPQSTSEPWRLLTGQLLHTSWSHLAVNLAAFAILAGSIECRSRALLVSGLGVGFGGVALWFLLQSEFTHYVGLSGALNALLLIALFGAHDDNRPGTGSVAQPGRHPRFNDALLALVALGALVKNVYEFENAGPLSELLLGASAAAWPNAPGAHLAGFAAGALLIACYWLDQQLEDQPQPLQARALARHNEAPEPNR